MGVVCTASEARWSRWVATAPTGRLWGVLAEPAPMAPALAAVLHTSTRSLPPRRQCLIPSSQRSWTY